MIATTSLPQAAFLLAFDPDSGKPRTHASSARIIQAAAIGELVVSHRARVIGGKVEPKDETPTGDRVADSILAGLSGPALFRNVLTSEDFAVKPGTRPEHVVREELEALGYATTEKGGMLHRTRLIATESSPASELTGQVAFAVRGGLDVDPRLAALIAILDVFGYMDKVVGEKLSSDDRATVDRIVSGSEFGVALRRASNEINVP